MDRVEVAGQITFEDAAAPRRVGAVLKLYPHGGDGMMHAPFRLISRLMRQSLPSGSGRSPFYQAANFPGNIRFFSPFFSRMG
jgi:hypothetical protein